MRSSGCGGPDHDRVSAMAGRSATVTSSGPRRRTRSDEVGEVTPRLGRLAAAAIVLGLAAGIVLVLPDPFTLISYCSYAGMGALLVIRQPRNTIGWLLVAIAFGFIGTTTPATLDVAGLQAGAAGPLET